MLEPPDLKNETILATLGVQFGIAVTKLEFIPRGEDSQAWVYRAETADGSAYLVIVDWDEVMLAPKERDLMFVVGGVGRGWVDAQQHQRGTSTGLRRFFFRIGASCEIRG